MTSWTLIVFLSGMLTAGFLASGLFFARFWSRTRDFLFMAFALAFWLLAADTALLIWVAPPNAQRFWLYLLRVPAYLLIVVAIVRKNTGRTEED